MGTGGWGLGNGESGDDSGCRNQLSAYRFPDLLNIFFK